MDLTELEELIKSRRSIRAWEDRDIPDELIRRALDIATYAPNAGNHQSWKFYVVKNRDVINKIADAAQRSADTIAAWPEAKEIGDTIERWNKISAFFRTAPCLIAACAGAYSSTADSLMRSRMEFDEQAKKMVKARDMASSRVQSVAAAIAYMLLAFHQMGLGAVWMTGPVQAQEEIEKILNIPDDLDFIALIPVGYPAETPRPKQMRQLDEVVEFIK